MVALTRHCSPRGHSILDWLYALGLLLIATFAAIAGLLVVSAVQVPNRRKPDSIFADNSQSTVFLLDGETLIDASPPARMLLSSYRVLGGNWLRLLAYLESRFPNIEARLKQLPEVGSLTLEGRAADGKATLLMAEYRGGVTRITLTDPALDGRPLPTDPLVMHALTDELDLLRNITEKAPILIWRETATGDVIWANSAYLLRAFAMPVAGRETSFPLRRVFDQKVTQSCAQGQRAAVNPPGNGPLWYELAAFPEASGGRLLFATPVDAAVGAETALRDFMQTLTKTFAQLPIGLAIFDQKRQLQLFNPALLDLTGLPADFLSLRPSLLSVLDALRDRNMLPEPKDYRNWRRQIVDMERAAASGQYEEVWELPDGATYRVVGRPHPNGALALVIEDISHEVSRSRRYRLDIELGQAVLDEMPEAVAVFSGSGHLVMTNQAFSALWGSGAADGLGKATVKTVARDWRALTAPSPLWDEIEDFVLMVGNRVPWTASARLTDGRPLACRIVPLAGGSTLAAFRPEDSSTALAPPKPRQSRRKSA